VGHSPRVPVQRAPALDTPFNASRKPFGLWDSSGACEPSRLHSGD
jgi:hypothetical protein